MTTTRGHSLPKDLQQIGSESWASSIVAPIGTVRWSESDKVMFVSVRSTGDQNELDLSEAPLRVLILEIKGNSYSTSSRNYPNPWSVTLPDGAVFVSIQVAQGTQAAVSLLGTPASSIVDIVSEDKLHGQVILRNSSIDKLYIRQAQVEVEAMSYESPAKQGIINYVHVESAAVSIKSRTVSDLLTADRCSVKLANTHLGVLLPLKTSVLTLQMEHSSIRAVRRTPLQRRLRNVSGPDLVLEGRSNMVVENLSDLDIVLKKASAVHCSLPARNVTVTGPGELHLQQGAQSVQFQDPPASIHVENHSQVIDVSGPVKLGDVGGASIIGKESTRRTYDSKRGFLVEGFSEQTPNLEGLSLVNVAFPVDLTGLQTVAVVHEAAFLVSPSLHNDLPGLGSLAGAKVSAHRKPKDSPSALQIKAQYARAIAELAREKGAPGSTRTLLAWCSYRMRNLVAPGRWERGILSAYRALGYGERVGPPVLALAVFILVFNVWALRHNTTSWDGDGIQLWFKGLLDWAVTPLHILKLTGDGRPEDFQFSQPWDTLARFVIAVPFATAVLALRNYVKEDSRRKT